MRENFSFATVTLSALSFVETLIKASLKNMSIFRSVCTWYDHQVLDFTYPTGNAVDGEQMTMAAGMFEVVVEPSLRSIFLALVESNLQNKYCTAS